MIYRKMPENMERLHEDYEVIAHYNGKVLLINEYGALFYTTGTEQEAPIGTVLDRKYLEPLQKLDAKERTRIHRLVGVSDEQDQTII